MNISACCCLVSIWDTVTRPSKTCCRKWWYLSAMCFVRGLIFGHFTSSTHPRLSSNTEQCTFGAFMRAGIALESSFRIAMSGITSRRLWDSATYSLSVVDRVISDWSFDEHITGQLAYLITYPVREKTDDGSSEPSIFQSPANDASTYNSRLLFRSGE